MLGSTGCHPTQSVNANGKSLTWTNVVWPLARSGKVGAFAASACADVRKCPYEYNLLSNSDHIRGLPSALTLAPCAVRDFTTYRLKIRPILCRHFLTQELGSE